MRAVVGGRASKTALHRRKPKFAPDLVVEPLEGRLAMAVASFNIPFGGPTGIDLFAQSAGAELGYAYGANRSYRDPDLTSPAPANIEVTTIPGGFYIADATVNESSGIASITVTRTTNPNRSATIDYSTGAGSARPGTGFGAVPRVDYFPGTGTLTFGVGETTKTINIPLNDDDVAEATENFFVYLANATETSGPVSPTPLRIHDGEALVTILDNEQAPQFSIDDVTANEDAGTMTFTVTRTGPQQGALTVDFSTLDGTAKSGKDYISNSGTLTFADGVATQTITIQILDEEIYENDETFFVTLANPQNLEGGGVGISRSTGTGTIINDEPLPILTVTSEEVKESAGTVKFTATLDRPSEIEIQVDYTTADVTTAQNTDYTRTTGTLIFAPGETLKEIIVPIIDDNTIEGEETFELRFTAHAGSLAPVLPPPSIGTIIDDDVRLSIADQQLSEDGGSMIFTIHREGATQVQTDVIYQTVPLTATSPADYNNTQGTVSFMPGDTDVIVSVPIVNDNIYEFTEQFTLKIVSATNPLGGNVVFTNQEATGTIIDDEIPPNVTINDVTAFEHTGSVTFTISLDKVVGIDTVITYQTYSLGTGVGNATASVDYSQVATTTVTIPAGSTSAQVTVAILEDTLLEGDEQFGVRLLSASNGAVITDADGIGTIKDNDNTIDFQDVIVAGPEGDGGNTLTFTVIRNSGAVDTVTEVQYTVVDDTAKAGQDYVPTSGTIRFDPGETSKTITVELLGDNLYEGTETFKVRLSAPTNSPGGTVTILRAEALGRIEDSDDPPTVRISDATAFEHEGTLTFNVSISGPSATDTVIQYTTVDGSATVGNGDYTAAINGTVTIPAGSTTATVVVTVKEDAELEGEEFFTVEITGASGLPIADSVGIGTIRDNDNHISIENATAGEETGTMTFAVRRAGSLDVATIANYSVSSGTATVGLDLAPASGQVSFGVGVDVVYITVPLIDDQYFEGPETFFVTLSGGSNVPGGTVIITTGTAIGTITETDVPPTISIATPAAVLEEAGQIVFTVTLTGALETATTVAWTTLDGTAAGGTDYAAMSGTLTFAAGNGPQTQQIVITLVNDHDVEFDEDFIVRLSNPVGAPGVSIATADGVGTIWSDDVRFTISDAPNANEGQHLSFTVTREGGEHVTSTIQHVMDGFGGGIGFNGADFNYSPGTLTFAPGQATQSIDLFIPNDGDAEFDGQVFLRILNPTTSNGGAVSIANDHAVGTVRTGLNAGDPTFTRPGGSGSYYYEAIGVNIGAFGEFGLRANTGSLSDTVIYVYYGSFNPGNPNANLVASNDDTFGLSAAVHIDADIFNGFLPGNYIFVITSYGAGATGYYSLQGY